MPPSPTASSKTTSRQTATSVIVLCGGASRRMGGVDKTRARLGATTVLDRLLDTLPSCWDVVCVGEERPTTRAVTWRRESPPGGGPGHRYRGRSPGGGILGGVWWSAVTCLSPQRH